MSSVKIIGMQQVVEKIKTLDDLEIAKPALKGAALHIKGVVNRYPPSSEANVPYQRRWYERGYGSKWMRRDGSVGGRKTSETLGRKWTIRTADRGLTVIVGNNVSYGPYVQDAKHQAGFHAARGWKTIQDVVKEESDTVVNFIVEHIERSLNR